MSDINEDMQNLLNAYDSNWDDYLALRKQFIEKYSLSVENLQEIRITELKDFNSKILQAELKNQKLQKEIDAVKKYIEESYKADKEDNKLLDLIIEAVAKLKSDNETLKKALTEIRANIEEHNQINDLSTDTALLLEGIDGIAFDALTGIVEKGLSQASKIPVTTDKLVPDYWIISGQVFKNKERFVKQQMEFNPGDIRENWENSFDHFAIPVYRDPIFVSEYENGVKASFVRQNKVLQEQLNTAKKALTEIIFFSQGCYAPEYFASIAQKALAAIGGDDE